MKTIQLSRGGFVAIVDDEDYEIVSQFKWSALVCHRMVYARRALRRPNGGQMWQLLHRFILGITDPKILVDHRDRNGLHCWRTNLRRATRSQNGTNRGKYSGSSLYLGVHQLKSGKWRAQIAPHGKPKHLGLFTDELSAALSYDKAAREYNGEFANLNFPHVFGNPQRSKRAKTSSFHGVSFDTRYHRKWCAQLYINNKRIYLCRFDTELDAALAVDAAIRQYFGDAAPRCNFPLKKPAISEFPESGVNPTRKESDQLCQL